MPLPSAYHRPHSINEAVQLLQGDNRILLAGGTIINADREHSTIEVVDLQGLDLTSISVDGDRLKIGSMTTLAALAAHDQVPSGIRSIARAELPSTLRTRATVGGTVAAMQSDSVLAAALLAADGIATLADGSTIALNQMFASGLQDGALITEVSIAASGTVSMAATGRTPGDIPIVAAVAHQLDAAITLAVTGVAATPVIVDVNDLQTGSDGASFLDPPDDFRGSADYRRHLGATLARRAVEALR